ncbi:unnamed protein product [Auanema sp. JU1783]|nr:unnamed protein product [Auanema sp. JU1783]
MTVPTLTSLRQMSPDICVKQALEVIRHPLIRFAQMCATLTCSLSLILLIRIMFKKLPKCSYHKNFKVLLWTFHFNALVHAVIISLSQAHQFLRGFIIEEPCDLFLDPNYYRCANVIIFFLMQYQVWLLLFMWLERLTATICQRNYERNVEFLGIIFLFFAAIVPAGLTYWAYTEEMWFDPAINVINTPSSSRIKVNIVFYVHLGICGFCLISIIIINLINKRLKIFKTHSSLSSRYQISENVMTTRILIYISIFTTAMYILYLCCTLTVRLTEQFSFFRNRYPLYQGLRNTSYVLPLFDLILPLVTQFVHDYGRRASAIKRLEIIATAATGDEGWRMYSSVIQKQWG